MEKIKKIEVNTGNLKKYLGKRLSLVGVAVALAFTLGGCSGKNNDEYTVDGILAGLSQKSETTNVDNNIPLVLGDQNLRENFANLGLDQNTSTAKEVEGSFIKSYYEKDIESCNDAIFIMNYSIIKSLVLEQFNISNERVEFFLIDGEYKTMENGEQKDYYYVNITYKDDFDESIQYLYAIEDSKTIEIIKQTRGALQHQLSEDEIVEAYYNSKNLFTKKAELSDDAKTFYDKECTGNIILKDDSKKSSALEDYFSSDDNQKTYKMNISFNK